MRRQHNNMGSEASSPPAKIARQLTPQPHPRRPSQKFHHLLSHTTICSKRWTLWQQQLVSAPGQPVPCSASQIINPFSLRCTTSNSKPRRLQQLCMSEYGFAQPQHARPSSPAPDPMSVDPTHVEEPIISANMVLVSGPMHGTSEGQQAQLFALAVQNRHPRHAEPTVDKTQLPINRVNPILLHISILRKIG